MEDEEESEMLSLIRSLQCAQIFEDHLRILNRISTLIPKSVSEIVYLASVLTDLLTESIYSATQAIESQTAIVVAARLQVTYAKTATESFVACLSLFNKASRLYVEAVVQDPQSNDDQAAATTKYIKLQKEIFGLADTLVVNVSDCTYLLHKQFIDLLQQFLKECFSLVKFACFPIQIIEGYNEELHREGQALVPLLTGAVMTLCMDSSSDTVNASNMMTPLPTPCVIVSSVVQDLVELGNLSASCEGRKTGLLNMAWKGVSNLLQKEKHKTLASILDIPDIIKTLISHAMESLNHATGIWSNHYTSSELVLDGKEREYKRLCIRIKFFLAHAVRIGCTYPRETFRVHREIVDCATKIFLLMLTANEHSLLKPISENIAEMVALLPLGLLHALFTSHEIDLQSKIKVLETLTPDDSRDQDLKNAEDFQMNVGNLPIAQLFLEATKFPPVLMSGGRVAVFLSVLKGSHTFHEELMVEFAKRLTWFLDGIARMPFYILLESRVPFVGALDHSNLVSQMLFLSVLEVFQTFCVVAVSNRKAWTEVEKFLFCNILHPLPVCQQLVMDIWCFIIRHSSPDFARFHIEKLYMLLKSTICDGCEICHQRRSLVRAICMLVKACPSVVGMQFAGLVFNEDTFSTDMSAVTALAFLQEGFPVNLLTVDSTKESAKFCMVTTDILEKSIDGKSLNRIQNVYYMALHCLAELVRHSDGGEFFEGHLIKRILEAALFNVVEDAREPISSNFVSALTSIMDIMSNLQHKIDPTFLKKALTSIKDLITQLNDLEGCKVKASLSQLLASLCEVPLAEDTKDSFSQAMWELYQFVLRERQWALCHAGLASFGHFAERTSCDELWRFVPFDAALSFDQSGISYNEDGFMTALKSFLKKEDKATSLDITTEELGHLVSEWASLIKRLALVKTSTNRNVEVEKFNLEESSSKQNVLLMNCNLKEPMEMLKGGLNMLKGRLPAWLNGEGRMPDNYQWLDSQLVYLVSEILALQDATRIGK